MRDGIERLRAMRVQQPSRRITTRLRFEPGTRVAQVGDIWRTVTMMGLAPVRVKLLKIKGTLTHEDGATLMDAQVRIWQLAE